MNAVSTSPRLLLIAPRFFGYEQEIASELTRTGYQVDLLPDRPFNSAFMKGFMRLFPELGGHQASDRFFAKQIAAFGRTDYETILVVQGEGVTANTLSYLRNAYPKARLVFYTWDSLQNKPSSKRNLSLYDRCFSFDREDAKQFGMKFRPLFYSNGFNRPENTSLIYDLSFVGTVHSDRYKIVRTLLEQLPPETRTFVYLYVQAPWMYELRRIFTNTVDGAKRDDFRFEPLSKELVQGTFLSSRAVLDIEHVKQRGATMRTMEALGSKRKIVTTNASLRDYDFYNPMNIHIVDRKAPRLDQQFLMTPYQSVPEDIRLKYSISQWIQDVCNS
jgi:hypothetical protein